MRAFLGRFLRLSRKAAKPVRRSPRYRLEITALEDRKLLFVGTITAVATPQLLFPPNGRYVPVAVVGTIIESGPHAPTAFFQVTDEYRRDEPRAHLELVRTSSTTYAYTFHIFLQADRSTRVPDGRHYDILVAAGDAQNGNGTTIAVIVPRDLAQFRMLSKPRPPEPKFRGRV